MAVSHEQTCHRLSPVSGCPAVVFRHGSKYHRKYDDERYHSPGKEGGEGEEIRHAIWFASHPSSMCIEGVVGFVFHGTFRRLAGGGLKGVSGRKSWDSI